MSRRFIFLLALGAVVGACGDQPLGGAGGVSRDWLGGDSSTTTTVVITESPTTTLAFSLRSAEDLEWFTAGGVELPEEPEAVVQLVWERTNRVDEYVQVSADEISGALPDLGFPSIVPRDIGHVTSQLVFSTNTGSLAREFQAAFGLWTVEPYSRDRSVAQYAVLWVARDSRPPASIEDPGGGCSQFADQVPDTCRAHDLGSKVAWLLTDRAGSTLIWFENGYRYELFHRNQITTDEALAMADSIEPLERLPG